MRGIAKETLQDALPIEMLRESVGGRSLHCRSFNGVHLETLKGWILTLCKCVRWSFLWNFTYSICGNYLGSQKCECRMKSDDEPMGFVSNGFKDLEPSNAQGMTNKAIPYLFKAFAIDAAQSQAMSGSELICRPLASTNIH